MSGVTLPNTLETQGYTEAQVRVMTEIAAEPDFHHYVGDLEGSRPRRNPVSMIWYDRRGGFHMRRIGVHGRILSAVDLPPFVVKLGRMLQDCLCDDHDPTCRHQRVDRVGCPDCGANPNCPIHGRGNGGEDG